MALAVGSTVFEVSRFTRAVSAVKSDSLATLTPPPLVSASALTGLLHALLQLVFRVHFELLYSFGALLCRLRLSSSLFELCGPFMGAEFGFGSKPS